MERIIETENCDVCGRSLDPESKNKVEELLSTVKLSSKVVGILHSMENPLVNSQEKLESFQMHRKEIQEQIKLYNDELTEINNEITEIDQKLSGYDVKKIKNWHNERLSLEERKEENILSLGSAKEQEKNLKHELKLLKIDYEKSLGKENKAIEIKKQLQFCEKALKAIKRYHE